MSFNSQILDGYSIKASVPGKGPWPTLEFHYRPLLAQAVCEFVDSPKSGFQRLKKIVNVLEKQLVSWDVKKPGTDEILATSAENIMKLPMSYIDAMINAVLTYSELEQEVDEKN